MSPTTIGGKVSPAASEQPDAGCVLFPVAHDCWLPHRRDA